LTCGESFVEPYLDYTWDLLNGKMKLKKVDYNRVFIDPKAKEYDFNDASYEIKVTYDLTEDEVIKLFPDKEKKIKDIDGKIEIDSWSPDKDRLGIEKQRTGYDDNTGTEWEDEEKKYDLLEYYYKKYVKKYFVVDRKANSFKEAKDKDEAVTYVSTVNSEPEGMSPEGKPRAMVIERIIPEIWLKSMIGHTDMDDAKVWCYPKYKGYPLIPYYAYRTTVPVKNRELMVQGIARGLKDLNNEYNKRRTQELRILNTSANSGWLSEQDVWVDKAKVRKFGSSPGINLEYKQGRQKPEKIIPTPLSQGHAQLAIENTQDLKESSGINTDLLAMSDTKTASGRAIHLRQKQGLVMVQKLFDNLSLTKRILGKFLLSQLGACYDLDTAIKVLGDSFVNENFQKPKLVPDIDPATGQPGVDPMTGQPNIDPQTGQAKMKPQIDPTTGELVMEMDVELLVNTVNDVLNDPQIGNYDVAVSESANNETIKYANFMTLMEMVERGIPVPPDVIIEESLLSEAHKDKIIKSIEKQQAMMMQQQQQQANPGK